MNPTKARTQSIQTHRTKFKLYTIMFPTHKGNGHFSQRALLKGTEFFSGVLGARRIQTLKTYSMILKITFIQTYKKQVLLLMFVDFYCISVVFSTLGTM